MKQFSLATSTATIAIFDEECLEHRVNQPADWWSDFTEEIDEVKAGNAIIVGLETDGVYSVDVEIGVDLSLPALPSVGGLLRVASGRLYIGPGEEIVGGGYKPSTLRHPSGVFLDLAQATYRVLVAKTEHDKLRVTIKRIDGTAGNAIDEQLLLHS